MLTWIPETERTQILSEFKGQKAVKFPAAYFPKCPGSKSPLWYNLSTNEGGLIIKTAPDKLVKNLTKMLDKYEQEYEVIQL